LTELLPDVWCFAPDESDPVKATINTLGLEQHDLVELNKWFRDRIDDNTVVWPSLFRNPWTAHDALRKFFQRNATENELVVLGLGVTRESAEAIDNEMESNAMPGTQLYIPELEVLRERQSLDDSGKVLGFEILCFFAIGGFSCSWYCNYLHQEGKKHLGVTPGKLGLLESQADAAAMAELCNRPEIAAEPGLWVPVLLVEFTPPSPDLN
jgi:hypothetical protein